MRVYYSLRVVPPFAFFSCIPHTSIPSAGVVLVLPDSPCFQEKTEMQFDERVRSKVDVSDIRVQTPDLGGLALLSHLIGHLIGRMFATNLGDVSSICEFLDDRLLLLIKPCKTSEKLARNPLEYRYQHHCYSAKHYTPLSIPVYPPCILKKC